MLWFIFISIAIVFIYHHLLYPRLLAFIAAKQPVKAVSEAKLSHRETPSIGVFIAAYNEAEFIEEKLHNLASQLYPNDKMGIHIVGDGCTDSTSLVVKRVSRHLHDQFIYCTYDEIKVNAGKVNALNYLIAKYRSEYDIVVFTDVSALMSVDCLEQVAMSLQNKEIVAVSGNYLPNSDAHESLDKYWQYQNAIRKLEGQLGAVNGFAGAMFAMRSEAVIKLAAKTINDDFVQVVSAIDKGHYAGFNESISIIEREADSSKQDFKRRVRIGAGNWQQLNTIFTAAKGFNKGQWLCFISNKVLRGVMPILLFVGFCALMLLAVKGDLLAQVLIASALSINLIGVVKSVFKWRLKLPILDAFNYLVSSYFAALIGILTLSRYNTPWRRVAHVKAHIPYIAICKRCVDFVGALVGLVLFSPIMLVAAIAIKLDSKGGVIYKQLRVGRINEDKTELIYVYKLRTMRFDAEKATGAVWAQGNDPRITRVGRFLRKTRIDELPQFWNVLWGDMSLIGPRPERPSFYSKLESEIPYFIQRTYGIKPGISGLAQVMNGYDESVEDVRNKIAWDYSYVLSMTRFSTWIAMEFDIVFKTIKVVVLGKGQ
ncbi:sugar transferase [Pseudoalteromonas sp. SSM20]|uniref:sugar transferase n=1 Tax=Pseudoalteromonas sp. SSM20 TaxID=3139394 RepID=UPI003BA90D9C